MMMQMQMMSRQNMPDPATQALVGEVIDQGILNIYCIIRHIISFGLYNMVTCKHNHDYLILIFQLREQAAKIQQL